MSNENSQNVNTPKEPEITVIYLDEEGVPELIEHFELSSTQSEQAPIAPEFGQKYGDVFEKKLQKCVDKIATTSGDVADVMTCAAEVSSEFLEEIIGDNDNTRNNFANTMFTNLIGTLNQNRRKLSSNNPEMLESLFGTIVEQMTSETEKVLGKEDAERMEKLGKMGQNLFAGMLPMVHDKVGNAPNVIAVQVYIEKLLKTEDLDTALMLAQERFDIPDGVTINTTLKLPVTITFPNSIKLKGKKLLKDAEEENEEEENEEEENEEEENEEEENEEESM
jgi:hypothetical protein